jgi:dienelactone hydrolase
MEMLARPRLAAIAGVACGLVLALPGTAAAFTPAPFSAVVEARNFAKVEERQAIYDTPGYQLLLRAVGLQNRVASLAEQVNDPARLFPDLCASGEDGCAGDVRLYGWQSGGAGIVQPVYFTARNGATVSGHVWATRSGAAHRPGIVITNGSVQADEQLYWFAAQTLAKAGYVVLTFDPQGQGQSDSFGEAPDQTEGFPAQTDGRPFFDGTEDAVNFFLSTPSRAYVPVPSCSTGTSHRGKQEARVEQRLDNAYNPFWSIVDPARLGLAGHSYGAAGVSYIAQWDGRVGAVVAWDNLSGTDPGGSAGGPVEKPCPANPAARRVAPITKPALGMSADYFLPPTPNTAQPDPLAKTAESIAYSKAGVDSGEIVIRGGSHLDFSFIPNAAFGASMRGADMIAWYTTAWFDKYLKGDAAADGRLLTTRWRDDAAEARVDLRHDANMMSFYYQSRLDIHRGGGGGVVDCEDLRAGCAALTAADGAPPAYSYLAVATTPDSGAVPPNAPSGTGLYPSTARLPSPLG